MKHFDIIVSGKIDDKGYLETARNWLLGTEELMMKCLQQYDPSATANVEMCCDISMPSNTIRFAGGFMTGIAVEWKTNIPFIPVDVTLNVCSSSVYWLDKDASDITLEQFTAAVEHVKSNGRNYIWNYNVGNHFITLGKTAEGRSCLITHSSASEFKKSLEHGLYPVEGNRYSNDIHTFQLGNRYLRYLIGDAAQKYMDIYAQIPDFNMKRQRFFAEGIADFLGCRITEENTQHHYGMKDNSIIHIGTFLANAGDVVPVFSKNGEKISFYKVSEDDPTIGKYKLIPHGWGKTHENLYKIAVENNSLMVGDYQYDIGRTKPKGTIRNYSGDNGNPDFYISRVAPYLHGEEQYAVAPMLSYNCEGFFDFH